MNATIEQRIEPSDIPADLQRRLSKLLAGSRNARLIGLDGEEIELPDAFCEALVYLLKVIESRQAVFMMPAEEAFTTQAAANFLGISRPYLVRLLEGGKLPYYRVGTHRRVLFKDLVAYDNARSEEREFKLSRMTKELVDAGLYGQAIRRDEEGNEIS